MKKHLLQHINEILRQIPTSPPGEGAAAGEEKGVERERGKPGPNHEALSPPPHPGCGVSTIFHDAFNLVLQLIENTHQLPLSDFIYCIREPALTGSPGRKSPRRLTDENQGGECRAGWRDVGISLGRGENSELGPAHECGAGQVGKLRVLETSMGTSWRGTLGTDS